MKYENLSRITEAQPAPATWSVVIADVRGSTVAIQSGRYRDVNLAGAACVAAIRNVFPPTRLPYVFGGDGATFLVSDVDLNVCLQILRGVQELVQTTLGLSLTVGHMSVKEIRSRGADVYFGFLSWSETEHLPFFRGDGIALAEREIKRLDGAPPTGQFGSLSDDANVEGLSCRLLPFNATRGQVLSVMIEINGDRVEEDKILEQIFDVLKSGGPLERLRPVSVENQRRPWISSTWRSEALVQSKGKGGMTHAGAQFKAIFEGLLGTFLFKFNISNPLIGLPSDYTQHMMRQSDWIKMDGTLRLVLDVTPEEESLLLAKLEELSLEKKVVYGSHASGATVMTCHFQSPVGHQHAHFIDGAGGGLTLAAMQLKTKKAILESFTNKRPKLA